MFEIIINHYKKQGLLPVSAIAFLERACHFWTSISEDTKIKLSLIRDKYTYENFIKIRDKTSNDVGLEFWKDGDDYGLTPAMREHDIDRDFLLSVPNLHGNVDYEGYESFDDECYGVLDRLFYSWISYLWQEVEGKECGIPVYTWENGSALMFCFNDFLDNQYSEFMEGEDKRINASPFTRKLSLEEIYVKAGLTHHLRLINDVHFFLEKDRNVIYLTSHNNRTIFKENETILENITHLPTKDHHDDSQLVAIKYLIHKSNELINDNWKLKIA
jgi:hypothetical protein